MGLVQCRLVGDWYYIGHYGQLGPLTREQIDELVEGGVIARETYVWRSGMDAWLPADRVRELAEAFRLSAPYAPPAPPPPPSPEIAPPVAKVAPPAPLYDPRPTGYGVPSAYPSLGGLRSDRSRTAAGVIQLLIPGVGRMYLGYLAYGVLQLITAFFCVGWIWSIVDGIVILSGGMKYDGYGRELTD